MSTRGIGERAADAVDVGVGDADRDDAGPAVVGEHEVGEHVGRVAAARVDELGERAPEPLLVLGAEDLDEAHLLDAAVREQRRVDVRSHSRAGGAPPLGVARAARPCSAPARGDHPVPAVGHRHEHHRRSPS